MMERAERPEQPSLPFARDERLVRDYLREVTGREVLLRVTENATSMISVKEEKTGLFLRLHRIFLHADRSVLDEVAHFVMRRNGRTPQIRKFIRENSGLLKKKQRRVEVRTQGRYHDLQALFESVNNEYFSGALAVDISWGRELPRHSVRRRTLGSYNPDTNIIRINPILDKGVVPSFFVEFVVYHEMLHAAMGVQGSNGRRVLHPKEFRRREKLFREYERAVDWERKRSSWR